ncbi:hypothetical protein [Guyparkeria sp.]|uniref:hypothetical protein n=1 Tax=Guyparkeria sp. TaxID=2035736 RepID=UPI0039707E24
MGEYQVIAQKGEALGGEVLAGLGVTVSRGVGRVVKAFNDPDLNGFLPTWEDGSAGLLFTNWEDRPGGMSWLAIEKDGGRPLGGVGCHDARLR